METPVPQAWQEAAREAAHALTGWEELELTHVRSSIAHVFAVSSPGAPEVVVRLLPASHHAQQLERAAQLGRIHELHPGLTFPPLSAPLAGEHPDLGGWSATLWPRLHRVPGGAETAAELGRLVAALHLGPAGEVVAPVEGPLGDWHIARNLNARISRLEGLLRRDAEAVRDELTARALEAPLPPGVASHGVCHGDVKLSNVVYTAEADAPWAEPRLINWDELHWGPRGAEFTKWAMNVLRRERCEHCLGVGLRSWYAACGQGFSEDEAQEVLDHYLRGPWVALRAWNAGAWEEWEARWGGEEWAGLREPALAAAAGWAG